MPQLRTIIAAAAVTLGVAAVPAASEAAFSTSRTATSTSLSSTSTTQIRTTSTTFNRPAPSFTLTYVTAGATGDGPADDAECDRWAININHYGQLAENQFASGTNDALAEQYAAQSAAYEDQAMDRGCFVVD